MEGKSLGDKGNCDAYYFGKIFRANLIGGDYIFPPVLKKSLRCRFEDGALILKYIAIYYQQLNEVKVFLNTTFVGDLPAFAFSQI